MNLYSIYDKKAQLYLKVFQLQNDVTAIRALTATILEQKDLTDYPSDYYLANLGELNETTGVITPTIPAPAVVEEIQSIVLSAKKLLIQNQPPSQ